MREWDPLAAAVARSRSRARDCRQAFRSALEEQTDDLLHRARIAAKKWRYALECVRIVHPDRSGDDERLRELQRVLGEVHDFATLRDVLAREALRLERHGLSEYGRALRPLIEEIEADRLSAVARFRESVAAIADETPADGGG